MLWSNTRKKTRESRESRHYSLRSQKIALLTFPGREFDDLDAYRAAKKQRVARRAVYVDQAHAFKSNYEKMRL